MKKKIYQKNGNIWLEEYIGENIVFQVSPQSLIILSQNNAPYSLEYYIGVLQGDPNEHKGVVIGSVIIECNNSYDEFKIQNTYLFVSRYKFKRIVYSSTYETIEDIFKAMDDNIELKN